MTLEAEAVHVFLAALTMASSSSTACSGSCSFSSRYACAHTCFRQAGGLLQACKCWCCRMFLSMHIPRVTFEPCSLPACQLQCMQEVTAEVGHSASHVRVTTTSVQHAGSAGAQQAVSPVSCLRLRCCQHTWQPACKPTQPSRLISLHAFHTVLPQPPIYRSMDRQFCQERCARQHSLLALAHEHLPGDI